jgi:hypothetical protein
VVNAQSTAWAAQGLVAAGTGGAPLKRALAYLGSLRAGDDHYRYSAASDQTPVWVTAQALLATNRAPFPLAVMPRDPAVRGGHAGSGDRASSGDPAAAATATSSGSPRTESDPTAAAGTKPAPSPGHGQKESGTGGAGPKGSKGGNSVDTRPAPEAEATHGADVESAAPEPASEPSDSSSSTPYVIGGLALLAAALGAGFFWYRRRLP